MDCSRDELFAILLARDLRAEDRTIQVGAAMPAARAAAVMANVTRLPDARIYTGFAITNVAAGAGAPAMYPFLFDPRTLAAGESWMVQQTVFDDMSRPDVFFVGGLQADRRGNVNLVGIGPGGTEGWKLRGPGPVALATMSTYCRGYYIVMPTHDPRTLVERVDKISALGDRQRRRELKLPGGGPRLLLSPLGVFGFGEDGEMELISVHEGVTGDNLREATGFPLRLPAELPRTEPPSAQELSLLRDVIDPEGTLRDGS